MEFTEGKINKGESLMYFSECFYLKAQTLVSMGAATFVEVNKALLNYVRPNRELSIILKSEIHGAQNVPELMRSLGSFKKSLRSHFLTTRRLPLLTQLNPKERYWKRKWQRTRLLAQPLWLIALKIINQVAEKTLIASSNNPSPILDLDPAAKEPPDEEETLMDLDASPERYLPDKEELNKELLH
ncbi:hypothetical protein DSO57_1011440 [Entomophthora muscae]|uniref:Uncharacterized protein n=1 Tax=Entomophthora muscae TaxID=34485 RepID=A0ACC2RKY5_9FUNG|nr:hypothetical protein DSO57_1011440 [Entomophthora muscae]